MTLSANESIAERFVGLTALVVFWAAFGSLAAGLVVWASDHSSEAAALLLGGGLIGLMALPGLRLLAMLATAKRERDWMLLASTLAVLAILIALTLRDAAGLG